MDCENGKESRTHPLAARTGLLLSALCVVLSIAACSAGTNGTSAGSQSPQDTTTALSWDGPNQAWVGANRSAPAAAGSPSNSVLEVDLPPDEAVKTVLVNEVQLVNPPDPAALVIAGRDDPATGASGALVICKLIIKDVDIEELQVENVLVSHATVVNFASQHGLDVTVDPVNVIRCGRGGVGVLAVGAASFQDQGVVLDSTVFDPSLASVRVIANDGKDGARLNEVQILGPVGFDGFIETLIINRSSVFGLVELRNLEIKELIVDTVTVDH
jgi:hypothetical protein